MKNLLVFTLLTATLLFASCKKDQSKTEMLTAKPWKMTGFTVNGQDYYPSYRECDKDNLSIFKTDGKFVMENGVLCDSTQTPTFTGTWSFADDETKLLISSWPHLLIHISPAEFTLERTDGNETKRFVYTAQ